MTHEAPGSRLARSRLRWLAPVFSVLVLALLVARASSCAESARGPAAVVAHPETRAAPAAKVAPADVASTAVPAAPAAADEVEDAGTARGVGSLPKLRNEPFLGGSKSGVFGLGLGNDVVPLDPRAAPGAPADPRAPPAQARE